MSQTTSSAAPQQNVSIVEGAAILIGIVIGVGIFKAPSIVAGNVSSEGMFLGLWLLGGFLAFVGGLCYAELGSSRPSTGGEYHYLTSAYGPSVGVLFAWARCTVIQTGAIAYVAFAYGDYANVLIPLGSQGPSIHALLIIVIITALNIRGTMEGKLAQVIFTTLTLLAVTIVIFAGLFFTKGVAAPAAAASSGGGILGLAMVFVLLTYGGWNEVAYISGELKDVRRTMVRMLVIGMAVIVASYLLINYAYLRVLGLDGMRQSSAVAADVMRLAAGDAGAIIISLCVIAAALSTLNATIFTGARAYYALGRDVPILHTLGIWSPAGHNPRNALLLQGAIALVLTLFGAMSQNGFQNLVAYTAPVFWFFLFLVGLSLMVFRWREPEHPRPFSVPLYPLPPLILCATSLWMMYGSLNYAGTGALMGAIVLLLGTPLIWLQRRQAPLEQQT
jgi:basic amino acid/polyamine antiporter, APA family